MSPGAARAKSPLDRATVLRAAIELADAEGAEAVSMRRLAQRLDVVPMALYKHVADKEDLLDGIVETLLADLPEPPTRRPEQWRIALRETLAGARAMVTAHPWARHVLESRTARTPAVLSHMERVSQILLQAGFSADLTHHVMHLLGNRIWGFSPELFPDKETHGTGRPARRRTWADPQPADYPGILAIAADARARRPAATGCDEDFEFDFALEVILDGVARRRRSGWSSDALSPAPSATDR